MNERERLFETVESVRASRYPDLDEALVQDVLSSQIQMQEDRAEARRRTEQAITQWASAHATSEAPDPETSP